MENLTSSSNRSTSEKIALRRTQSILQEFRELQSDMTVKTASIFAYIAANPGISISELREQTNTKQSTCSRTVALLSEWETYEAPGFSLVWTEEDPQERRKKLVHLTDKGEEFAALLSDYVR